MNVNDFEAPATPADWPTALGLIFQRQRELMEQYKTIEGLPEPPLSLHHASGQKVLKDFAWRVTEELAESWEALERSWAVGVSGDEIVAHLPHALGDEIVAHLQHAFEEYADALHFFAELLIFSGIGSQSFLVEHPSYPPPTSILSVTADDLRRSYWAVVFELGIAMNFLRNKPWKQSQVPTDEGRFRAQLIKAFSALIMLGSDIGLEWQEAFAFYFRKSEVNRFRQRSQY